LLIPIRRPVFETITVAAVIIGLITLMVIVIKAAEAYKILLRTGEPNMKRCVSLLTCISLFGLLAFAAAPKTYQVTGLVLEVKGDIVTVQKGTEKWEISIDKTTKVSGDLKVGAKVTIEYQMKATAIEVKTDTPKPAVPKKK
jgi:hypothetical protein